MTVDIDALILEVRKRPPLYDTSNKEYHDRRLKKRLWEEVCCTLRTPDIWESMNSKHKIKYEKEVLKKWNSLRTCFRRELRANRFYADGIPEKKKRKYIYFDDLQFLLPFTKVIDNELSMDNDQASDLSGLSDEDVSESRDLISQTEKTNSVYYEEPTIPLPILIKTETTLEIETNSEPIDFSDEEITPNINVVTHPNTQAKNITYKSDTIHKHAITGSSRLLGHKRLSRLSEVDDDEAFLSSLLPPLKEFSSEQKLRLRIELLTTILNFKKSINS